MSRKKNFFLFAAISLGIWIFSPSATYASPCCQARAGSTPLPFCTARTAPTCGSMGSPPGGTHYADVTCETTPNCPGYSATAPGASQPGPAQCCQQVGSGGRQISCTALTTTSCTPPTGAPFGSAYQQVSCATTTGCPNFEGTPPSQPPPPAIVFPNLQIPIPTLTKPFTELVSTVTNAQGTFLDINFIGVYIIGIYRYLVGIVAILAGIMIIWAGVTWLTSAGNPEHITDAKHKIANAVTGLFLILGSYVILNLVNPELTIFKPLLVRFVETELIETIENPIIGGADCGSGPAGNFDSLFKKYANCSGVDWRVLRTIADKESGLRAGCVNRAGFIGLFQAKPQYCSLPQQFKDRCTPAGLSNPAVNIAVGALKIKDGLQLVKRYCSDGDPKVQFSILYGANSSGTGGTKAALLYAKEHGGCTVENVRKGFMEFWKNYKSNTCGGKTCTDWFVRYHGAERCQKYSDKGDCMGGEKYEHTLKAADAYISQGGGNVSVAPTGPCPLNTADPFPAS